MTTDLRGQLQSSLGASYTLDRELGGGGMSHVFVADETALGRKVVVKVLRNDLAEGISSDRFRREILLAAGLQQANIVPVLSAGVSEGLPYYTMPLVTGESLRTRLARDGALPVSEVVSILRDVARALAYAHAQGVVHRDIKPDNILISGGTAVVTDFGIAKALSAARADAPSATLTSVGTSIGTPAYMAPEQAAGDPDVDHRADLYAIGCVAYELLAGQVPFANRSPQRMLAAHLSETPKPVTDYRPECPAPLAALVMRLLEKEPANRPASATEILQSLEAVTTTPGTSMDALPAISMATRRALTRALAIYAAAFVAVTILSKAAIIGIGLPDWVFPASLIVMALGLPVILFTAFVHHGSRVARTMALATTPGGSPAANSTMTRIAVQASPFVSWRRTAFGGIGAVIALALLVASYMTLRALGIGPAGSLFAAGKLNDRDRILVADFKAPASDSGLGGVVTEAVRTNLGQSRAVAVVPASFVASALQRMQRPKTARVDLDLAREIAQREGVKAIVDGDVTPIGNGYIVTLRLLSAESGDELASFRETADTPKELIPTIDKVTRALRGKMGESLKAVRAAASLAQVTTTSLPALRKFTEAYRAHYLERDFRHSAAAAEEAIRLDSNFAMAYRLASLAYSNLSTRLQHRDSLRRKAFDLRERLPELERALVEGTYYGSVDRAKAVDAYQRVLAIDPTHTTTLNTLALAYNSMRDYAKSESLFRRAIAVGDGNALVRINVLSTLIDGGKLAAADSAIAAARATPGSHGQLERRAGQLAWNRGQYDSAWTMLRQVAATYHDVDGDNAAFDLANIAATRGRFDESFRLLRDARARRNARRGDSTDMTDAAWDSIFFEGWVRKDTAVTVRHLDALLAANPKLRSNPFALTTYAHLGNARAARAVLQRHDAEADTAQRRHESSVHNYWMGEIALAERRYRDAVSLFRQADTLYDHQPIGCPTCIPEALSWAFDQAGERDSAIVYMEKYLATPSVDRIGPDSDVLPYFHRRLGALYEEKGDRVRAAQHYREFIELWKNADASMQPQVREAKLRLSRLTDIETRR